MVLISGAAAPHYAHPGDAGADLCSTQSVTLRPGQRAVVQTGLHIALPNGYVAFVMPRSGLALKHGISLVNSPGTIDAGYRGEIAVIMLNTDSENDFVIEPGDRIAQLVIMPVSTAQFVSVEELPGTERGTGGFGSTGVARKDTE